MVESGFLGILQIIGALSLFIYGMKVMSEGLQRMASMPLRDALQRVTQSKIPTFLTGFFTSALLQSSSAATIMTVSFVNAGIISLTAAAGMVIGANLGSSVTVWMVTILGFEYNLFAICLPMIAIAVPFIFVKNGKYRHLAETVIGFALLLIALQFLKSVVPDLQKQQEVISFISRLGHHGFPSIFFFLTIGLVFTALIQSSSASMALTITFCLTGWLPFEVAAVMVLGANIGTTISTEIASWVGNIESKKAARLHLVFNLVGTLIFLPLLPLILSSISWFMVYVLKTGNPFLDKWAMPTGLAIFYTLFNCVFALFFLIAMPWFIRIASRTVNTKAKESDSVKFIDTGSNTADLSLPIVLQEVIQQCQRIKSINSALNKIINFTTELEFNDLLTNVDTHQGKLILHQQAINAYLISMVEDKSSLITSKQIKILLNTNLLIDHIRMAYENIYLLIPEKRKHRVWFGPTQRSMLLHRINDAAVMINRCIEVLQSGSFQKNLWKNYAIDNLQKKQEYVEIESEFLEELNRGEMKLPSVITYYRLTHHLDNINEYLKIVLTELSGEQIFNDEIIPSTT